MAGVHRRPRRIIYTNEESFTVGRPELPANWKDRNLVCVKYVDDCLSIEKLCYSGAERFNVNGSTYALARAMKSESHFNTIEFNAASKGMKINNNKTKMMCISNARTYIPASYVITTTGERLEKESVSYTHLTLPTIYSV